MSDRDMTSNGHAAVRRAIGCASLLIAFAMCSSVACQREAGPEPPSTPHVLPEPEGYEFFELLQELAQHDDLETTMVLSTLWRNAPASTRAEQWRQLAIENALYEQIWRTGRATDLGLCPREPAVKRVPDLERRATDDSIGTAHPLVVHNIEENGAWFFISQARRDTNGDGVIDVRVGHHSYEGDEVRAYLVWGSGPGWQIDQFVAADPLGNVVAVRNGACLELVDMRARPGPTVTTLPNADLRDIGIFGVNRGVAFDARGERMLYLRGGPSDQLVVRELESGREIVLETGHTFVEKARLDPEGRRIHATLDLTGEPSMGFETRECRGCGVNCNPMPFTDKHMPTNRERVITLDDGAIYDGNAIWARFGNNILREIDGDLAEALLSRLPGEVRVLKGSFPALMGTYAERDDGKMLVMQARDRRDPSRVPVGPLRWK